ncbi:MAG: hypothetical protein FE834_06750 [Gammaproteobacteria bacterium]|nr:hypothetical protein [Gammaproteobacteria bacterium]
MKSSKHKDITANLFFNGHANLDSFPFRFGYHSKKDTEIKLTDIEIINDKVHDSENRYKVRAYFYLPNKNKRLRSTFVLLKSNNSIVTVIKWSAYGVEDKLLDVIREQREKGYITPDDIIEMHRQKIDNRMGVQQYLHDKIGNEKVEAIEAKCGKKVEYLTNALLKSNIRADQAESDKEEMRYDLIAEIIKTDEEKAKVNKLELDNKALKKEIEKLKSGYRSIISSVNNYVNDSLLSERYAS